MRKLVYIIILASLVISCGGDKTKVADAVEFSASPKSDEAHPTVIPPAASSVAPVQSGYEPGVENPLEEMPGNCVPLHTNSVGNLCEVFNDSNYVHWNEAERIGIKPLSDMRTHWNPGRRLYRIASCRDFWLDSLTHSRPYLVAEGVAVVHEIGRRFRDSLKARGGGDYRIRVTSVLRTPDAVRRLRRINRNAIDSSVHKMGTTVDISYAQFIADNASVPRTAESLKALLAEVLMAMRNEGKIFVKYERKQPCFHITARGASK